MKMKTLTSYLKMRIVIAVALFATVLGLAVPTPVLAGCKEGEQQISLPVDQGGTTCIPINPRGSSIDQNPIFFYLRHILIFLAGGVGLAVVGGIVTGAYLYITARANAAQTQKGQNIIINSVIGLFLFIFMFAIMQFLIPGGVFR
jgi:hypothetical protein